MNTGYFYAPYIPLDSSSERKTPMNDNKFYLNAEITIGFGLGLGGYIHPNLRLDPTDLSKETEDKFVTAATAMMREAFATARKQQGIRESLGTCQRDNDYFDAESAKTWQK
jgi:hypothetical protein